MAREANWRCCAMVSATSFRAATFSSGSVMICVVREGIASSGFGGGTTSSSVAEDIVARREVWKSGVRKCEEEGVGWRRGVEVWELSVDGGRRTRLARRKVKNARREGEVVSPKRMKEKSSEENTTSFSKQRLSAANNTMCMYICVPLCLSLSKKKNRNVSFRRSSNLPEADQKEGRKSTNQHSSAAQERASVPP